MHTVVGVAVLFIEHKVLTHFYIRKLHTVYAEHLAVTLIWRFGDVD